MIDSRASFNTKAPSPSRYCTDSVSCFLECPEYWPYFCTAGESCNLSSAIINMLHAVYARFWHPLDKQTLLLAQLKVAVVNFSTLLLWHTGWIQNFLKDF